MNSSNTGMPEGKGSITTILPSDEKLGKDQKNILNAKLNLFELRKPKTNPMGAQDFGPIGVVVDNILNEVTGLIESHIKWLDGDSAYLKYKSDPTTSVCYGYIPDDPWWFNRMWLASNISSGLFIINRYFRHDHPEPVSGTRITEEIRFVEDYTHEWKLVIGKESITRSKQLNVINAEYEKLIEAGRRPQVIYTKVAEIERIIAKYRSRWINSPDFQQGYLPGLKAAISEKFADRRQPANIDFKTELIKAFRELTPQERLALMAEADADKPMTDKRIDELNDAEADETAEKYGIDPAGLSLGQKIAQIKKAAGMKFEFDEDTENQPEKEELPFGDRTQVVNFTE